MINVCETISKELQDKIEKLEDSIDCYNSIDDTEITDKIKNDINKLKELIRLFSI